MGPGRLLRRQPGGPQPPPSPPSATPVQAPEVKERAAAPAVGIDELKKAIEDVIGEKLNLMDQIMDTVSKLSERLDKLGEDVVELRSSLDALKGRIDELQKSFSETLGGMPPPPKIVPKVEVSRVTLEAFRDALKFIGVSIDEKILELAFIEQMQRSVYEPIPATELETQFIELRKEYRWEMSSNPDHLLIGNEENQDYHPYPVYLPAVEIKEAARDLTAQIRIRDYRLIRQSNCVAHYRPQWAGKQSSGVRSEIQYARDTAIVPCYAVFKKEDGDPDKSFFARPGVIYETVGELIEGLKAHEQLKRKRGRRWISEENHMG